MQLSVDAHASVSARLAVGPHPGLTPHFKTEQRERKRTSGWIQPVVTALCTSSGQDDDDESGLCCEV